MSSSPPVTASIPSLGSMATQNTDPGGTRPTDINITRHSDERQILSQVTIIDSKIMDTGIKKMEAGTGVEFCWSGGTAIPALEILWFMRALQQFQWGLWA